MMKNTLVTVLAAAAISTPALIAPAMFTPAAAQVDLSLNIGVPPPAPIYEAVPAPRVGYVWAPGFWRRTVFRPSRLGDRAAGWRSAAAITGRPIAGRTVKAAGVTRPATGIATSNAMASITGTRLSA